MQKRTRIITVATLLTGLLLGVGMLLATIGQAALPVGAAGQGHHRGGNNHGGKKTVVVVKKGGQTQTITLTNTVNNTITVVPPGPPAPFCFITPNPIPLAVGSPYGPNPPAGSSQASAPGDAQFELECKNLGTSTSFKIVAVFPCTGGIPTGGNFFGHNVTPLVNSRPVPTAIFISPKETLIPDVFPDLNGNLQITFVLEGCQTGAGAVTVIDGGNGSAINLSGNLVTSF